MTLLGLFYAEFDNVEGPKICYQYPRDVLSQDVFDSISDYVIMSRPLAERTVTVRCEHVLVSSFPMVIQAEKYDRNALLFAVGVVLLSTQAAAAAAAAAAGGGAGASAGAATMSALKVGGGRGRGREGAGITARADGEYGDAGEDVEAEEGEEEDATSPYEPVIRKLATTLVSMEQECMFLFHPESKARINDMLPVICHGLWERGECVVHLDEANILALKLNYEAAPPPLIEDHDVPVLLRDRAYLRTLSWDLALQQVIPHIDGVKYTARLAIDAKMDIASFKACLRMLLFYGCIALTDIFQYSNRYQPTELFPLLMTDKDLLQECTAFVGRPASGAGRAASAGGDGTSGPNTNSGNRCGLTAEHIVRLYGALGPDKSVAQVVKSQHELMLKVDHRKFIAFGVVKGLIRRVHEFPICMARPTVPTSRDMIVANKRSLSNSMGNTAATLTERVRAAMDGSKCMDQLCCEFLMSPQALVALAETGDAHTVVRQPDRVYIV